MQWSDVARPPSQQMLRQFAGLWLVLFLTMAVWRWSTGHHDAWTMTIGGLAVIVGAAGLIKPVLVKPVFVGWMIAAFPIGWTISRVALGVIFFLVVTPLGLVFRVARRDVLRLRRTTGDTYWVARQPSPDARTYLRQS